MVFYNLSLNLDEKRDLEFNIESYEKINKKKFFNF